MLQACADGIGDRGAATADAANVEAQRELAHAVAEIRGGTTRR